MIKDQLQRKYEALLSRDRSSAPNLLEVSRWYHNQEANVRAKMDNTEPLTWMKHLWDKHPPVGARKSSWSPPAFVVEEFINTHSSPHVMDTIPENDVILPLSPNAASFSDTRSPTSSSYSWATTPRHSLEAAVSRVRTSGDAQVSFEPMVESGRDSVGGDSRRSSDNYKGWKAAGVDSTPSSIYSMKGPSPNSSRRRLRDLKKRLALRGSDEALSSARNSMSENSGHSASEDGGHSLHHKIAAVLQPKSRPTSLHLPSSTHPTSSQDEKRHSNDATSPGDRKSTRLNSSHSGESRMPSSA